MPGADIFMAWVNDDGSVEAYVRNTSFCHNLKRYLTISYVGPFCTGFHYSDNRHRTKLPSHWRDGKCDSHCNKIFSILGYL